MQALVQELSSRFQRVVLRSKPLPAPEPIRPAPKPMTGFLATLSDEQRKQALEYCGADHHGRYPS